MNTKTILITIAGILFFISCNNKTKQPKEEALWNEPVTETPVTEKAIVVEDTTIHEWPATTAHLDNAIEYFRQNNKFKDWDKNDKRTVFIRGVVEKNGKFSTVIKISGDENEELRKEAIRLVKAATISPAENEKGEPIRSYWANVIEFPPK